MLFSVIQQQQQINKWQKPLLKNKNFSGLNCQTAGLSLSHEKPQTVPASRKTFGYDDGIFKPLYTAAPMLSSFPTRNWLNPSSSSDSFSGPNSRLVKTNIFVSCKDASVGIAENFIEFNQLSSTLLARAEFLIPMQRPLLHTPSRIHHIMKLHMYDYHNTLLLMKWNTRQTKCIES